MMRMVMAVMVMAIVAMTGRDMIVVVMFVVAMMRMGHGLILHARAFCGKREQAGRVKRGRWALA